MKRKKATKAKTSKGKAPKKRRGYERRVSDGVGAANVTDNALALAQVTVEAVSEEVIVASEAWRMIGMASPCEFGPPKKLHECVVRAVSYAQTANVEGDRRYGIAGLRVFTELLQRAMFSAPGWEYGLGDSDGETSPFPATATLLRACFGRLHIAHGEPVSVRELATLAGITDAAVRMALRSGKLRGRIGDTRRDGWTIAPGDAAAWLTERGVLTPAATPQTAPTPVPAGAHVRPI